MSLGEYFNAFGSLGDAYRQGVEEADKKAMLTALGQQLQGGDFGSAANTAFKAGDLSTGLNLLKLGQSAEQQKAAQAAFGGLLSSYGWGAPDATGLGTGAGALPPLTPRSSTPRLPTFTDASGDGGSYIANLFRRESGNNPNAQAPTSSAKGLGQFTTGTWNAVARQHPELGLTPDGRTDPAQMLKATQAFTADNEKILTNAGLPVNDATRYSLHFLGAGGGPKFVAGALSNPDAPAVAFVQPAQAQANRTIFFNRDGSPKSAGQVLNSFARSFGGGTQVAQAPVAVPTFGAPVADAGDESPAMQMPGVIANPPLPPQRPVQIASADPESLALPAGASGLNPAAGQAVPASAPMQAPPIAAPGGQRAMTMPPVVPAPGAASMQTASLPAQPAASASGDGEADAPDAPAPAAPSVSPQVRAQVSASAPAHLAQAGIPAPIATGIGAAPPASQQRIGMLLRLSMMPGLSEGQSKVVGTLLTNELDQTKMPESVKQYIFAKSPAGGGFDGSFADFQNKTKDEGAKIQAQFEARKKIAIAQGMDLNDPGVKSWLIGGGKGQSNHVLHQMDELRDPTGKLLARNDGGGAGGMSDEAAAYTADRVIAGDTKALIGLDKSARGRITALAAQRAIERGIDPTDILHNAAVASGMNAEERSRGTSAARMGNAAVEAEGAIAQGRLASAAVPRGSFVPFNRAMQVIQSNTGDPNLKAFVAANMAIANTYARAISPTGTPTVADKEHAYHVLSTADGPEAYNAVLDQYQREIRMAHSAPAKAAAISYQERRGAKGGDATLPTTIPNPVAPDAPPVSQPVPAPAARAPVAQYREGQTATGPNGQKVIFSRGQWVPLNSAPTTTTSPQAGGVL